jgi:hypothetical protein
MLMRVCAECTAGDACEPAMAGSGLPAPSASSHPPDIAALCCVVVTVLCYATLMPCRISQNNNVLNNARANTNAASTDGSSDKEST